jgi:hypothetical protein
MKTEEEKRLEQQRRDQQRNLDKQERKGGAKGFFIVLLALCTLGAGYYAWDQHKQKEALEANSTFDRNQMQGEALEAYQEIEKNLAEISAHEGVLRTSITTSRRTEGPLSPNDRIQQEIDIINALVAHNNELIDNLSRQVNDKDRQLAMYNNNITNLNKRLKKYQSDAEELEKRNTQLTADLDESRLQNADLSDEIRMKTSEIDRQMYELDQQQGIITAQNASLIEQETEMNTVYYAVGSYSDLRDAEILEKEGGVIGIGTTKTIRDDFNQDRFTQIDSRDYTIIPIYAKRAELVSKHPRSSYEWVEDDNGISWLRIKNPSKFWESSKYLVVVTGGADMSAEKNTDVIK